MAEFHCFFCLNPADRVAYYSKSYGSQMGHTIENPTLCCESCYKSPRIINQINPMRGGDEGIFSFKFSAIGQWSNKQVAFYTSTRKWEINHLSTKPMRKLIWRIHFKFTPKKELNGIENVTSCDSIQ